MSDKAGCGNASTFGYVVHYSHPGENEQAAASLEPVEA